jgi:hypothetical protein
MTLEATSNPALGGRVKKNKPHPGVQVLNWTLLIASLCGALAAGIWTSGVLLGEFLTDSIFVPIEGQAEEALTLFDYMSSIVAGFWIGYVIFFILWDCTLKRAGMFFSAKDPFGRMFAKWK